MHANRAAVAAIKHSLTILSVIGIEALSDLLDSAIEIESHDTHELCLSEATFADGSSLWACQQGSQALIVRLNSKHLTLEAPSAGT